MLQFSIFPHFVAFGFWIWNIKRRLLDWPVERYGGSIPVVFRFRLFLGERLHEACGGGGGAGRRLLVVDPAHHQAVEQDVGRCPGEGAPLAHRLLVHAVVHEHHHRRRHPERHPRRHHRVPLVHFKGALAHVRPLPLQELICRVPTNSPNSTIWIFTEDVDLIY